MEPALEPKLSKDMGMIGSHGPRPQEAVEKAKFQLDNFVKTNDSNYLSEYSNHVAINPVLSLDQNANKVRHKNLSPSPPLN